MTTPTNPRTTTDPAPGDRGAALPPRSTTAMAAVVQDRYGAADVLHLSRDEVPTAAAGEVLIRVHAAGLDRGTWHLMTGEPYLMRLVTGFRRPKARVPGRDVAGTVVAVGSAVTRFAEGDEVFGIGRGTYAEYAVAREDKLAVKPSGASFVDAAVVSISATTALQALRDAGRVQAGQHVLVVGASGGVGSYAVQLAKAFGAEVTGVSSAAKLDLVGSLGADHVIDYGKEDFADGTRRYDLILDIGGNATLSRLRRALTDRGTVVIVGGETGGRWTGGIGRQLRALALSPFLRQRLTMLVVKERCADLEELAGLLATGRITPAVDRTCSLSGVPEAMRDLEAGRVRGKVAITVAVS